MIYINGKFLTQQITGVQKFALEITKQLISLNDEIRVLIPQNSVITSDDIFIKEKLIEIGEGNIFFWEQITLPIYLRSKGSPLLLNFSGLGAIFYKNKIITIHDMSFWEHPEWFSKLYALTYQKLTPISAKRSRRILTVSNYSKSVIIQKIKIKEEFVEVINNAVDKCTCNIENANRNKWILTVGSLDPRKNLKNLIRAFIKWNNQEYRLIVVGGKQKSFSKLDLPQHDNIFYAGYVEDELLHDYYCKSDFFVYPSIYEGFGIPPLEAMAHGLPVVVSNATSLPEVCGDASIYINPHSIDDIVNVLEKVSSDIELKQYLVKQGAKNINRFSWNESAKKINSIILKFKVK